MRVLFILAVMCFCTSTTLAAIYSRCTFCNLCISSSNTRKVIRRFGEGLSARSLSSRTDRVPLSVEHSSSGSTIKNILIRIFISTCSNVKSTSRVGRVPLFKFVAHNALVSVVSDLRLSTNWRQMLAIRSAGFCEASSLHLQ